ncbi:deoxyribodipyrimidine photolyase [Legionella qingyii]|uniref:Deoxyribodipyrimidine photo-lyase n=1 Tax=Legionella qingyii TaxID=2184757 RepID=A0A317TYV3_9GAMM|nr:deoxyribodipyrimidine photo-lyase [Legionella qingyii]PWY54248.1 deoxyribodipyrimidine photolyase [Legionella qingyii]RUR20140.1 deoxyribodipyrimidine photo-lyase [Legionella qingyii]
MSTAIVWFRQDLRCHDNPALYAACKNHREIIPLYILEDPCESIGRSQGWWLHHSLSSLQKELKKHGLELCLRKGNALLILKKLMEHHAITEIYWNRCYEPASIARDKHIKKELTTLGIKVNSFNGSLLNEPWTIKNKNGEYFKVFTPFWKQCLKQIEIPNTLIVDKWPDSPEINSDNIFNWNLLPKNPDWAKEFHAFWEPGELGALKKLDLFIQHHLQNYKKYRDEPSKTGTSRLSPHLHFGEISPWQVWRAIDQAQFQQDFDLGSVERFLAELGWREFSYHLLYHAPSLPHDNFRPEFDAFLWQNDNEQLKLWQKGLTGFPIIDAGMRELWRTGYMHNRVRMIVASFLVKDLLIDWREGAKWFWYTLLDADLANNSASWQWVAGSGADAAPYFRIFNPILQGEKFDPQGQYVKTWVPELAQVSSKWVHKPWEAPQNELLITLGKDYPFPIVDHNLARKRALQLYQEIKRR